MKSLSILFVGIAILFCISFISCAKPTIEAQITDTIQVNTSLIQDTIIVDSVK